jgi:hypothetical protein
MGEATRAFLNQQSFSIIDFFYDAKTNRLKSILEQDIINSNILCVQIETFFILN